jgi:hypothetical protein
MKLDEWGDADPGAVSIEPLEVSCWKWHRGCVLTLKPETDERAAHNWVAVSFRHGAIAPNGIAFTLVMNLHELRIRVKFR